MSVAAFTPGTGVATPGTAPPLRGAASETTAVASFFSGRRNTIFAGNAKLAAAPASVDEGGADEEDEDEDEAEV